MESTKKAKKTMQKKAQAAASALDPSDQAALNRRAQRFQREHEIERKKTTNGAYGGYKASSNSSNVYGNQNIGDNAAYDDPDADPVGYMVSGSSYVLILTWLRAERS